MIRAATWISRSPPTRSKFCSCRKRRNLVCRVGVRSAISSRKTLPPLAASRRPGLSLTAPVNAPRMCPNNSLSSNSSESVVQLTTTNGFLWRAPLDFAQQFKSAHLGHLVVGKNEIELDLGKERDGLRTVLCRANQVAERLEERGEAAADVARVIENEHLVQQ